MNIATLRRRLWLLPAGLLLGALELPYQWLSELGFRLQVLWPLGESLGWPDQPLVLLGPLLGTPLFLALAWGPLAGGRGGGLTGVQALQLPGLSEEQRDRALAALELRRQLMRLPLLALTHLAGLAVGIESPSAALGSSLLLALRQRISALRALPAGLTAAIGAGAGLGAAFRSPLLGATYALEELSAEKGLSLVLPTLVLAAIGALLNPGLGQPALLTEQLVAGLAPSLWPWAVAITAGSALVGVAFVRVVVALAPRISRALHRRFLPCCLGLSLLLTLLALASGGLSLNDGSLNLGPALAGQTDSPWWAALPRFVSPLFALTLGAPGGLMHDCMSLGAVLTSPFVGALPADQRGVLMAIGATALFAGACRTPLFCGVFVFTLQGNPLLVPWLLLASALATAIAEPFGVPTWNEVQRDAFLRPARGDG